MRKYLLFLALGLSYLTLNAQTTVWSDNFDDEDISNWTLIDSDGDGFLWDVAQLVDGDTGEPIGTPILTSVSWSGFPLTPDNWAISPAIDLTGVSGDVTLKWFVFASDPLWNEENYGVYVSTTNTAAGMIAAGELFTEFDLPSELEERTLDLSSFAGQTVYVGFRHYDVTDQFRIGIDDVSVEAGGGGPAEGCLEADNGQYPSAIYVPSCNGTAETITSAGWTGEYSMVTVTSGEEYIFSVSDPSYFITIGNEAGDAVIASGTGSVTWTANLSGNVRFYTHFTSACDFDSETFLTRFIQCGEVPPPPADCEDYEILSNNLENGLFLGGDTAQHLATDIPVGDTGFTIYGMEPTLIGEATSFEFIIYDDNAGIPGTQLETRTGSILGEVVTGNNFGFDFIKYTVGFDSPLDLDANTTYWIEVISDADGWETTTASAPIGHGDVFYNTNTANAWTSTDGDELVFNLICEEVGGPDPDCFQEVLSNNLENGLFLGGADNQRLAVDVIVEANTKFTIESVDPTIIIPEGGEATTFDFIVYSDEGGLPGTELETRTGTITGSTVTGQNFGRDFIRYNVELSAPIELETGTYWLEMTSDAEGWEATTADVFGSTLVFSNASTTGTWVNDGTGTELVYKINGTCETLGVSDMDSFDFAYYPNPVKDELNITSQKVVQSVSVYNLAGQQVSAQKFNATNGKVSTSSLAPGVYVFRAVLEGGQVETFKVVKK